MATNQSSTEQNSTIRIDIDGKKYLVELSHSSSAAKLRTILSKRYHLSSNIHFLDSEGYTLFSGDEKLVTISHLLNKDNIVKLVTDNNESTPIQIPEKKDEACAKKLDLEHVQTLSQSTETDSHELKPPDSTPTHSENKIMLATDLNLDMWGKIFRNCNLFYGIRMDKETPIRAFKPVLKFKGTIDNIEFLVTDDSYIRTYMKDKEMHSSFLSGEFFDGGINLSSPFIGIGINAEYTKSKRTANIKKKTYLTYCFNFPRVTLQLDLSYLELTTQFIEVIDTVLAITDQDKQIIKLEEVLLTYGHVYPGSVVLGGHLYHTEVHDNQGKAEEAKKRMSVDVSLSPPMLIQLAQIHCGAGSEKQSEDKSSEKTSLLTFEAVGGDTRLNHDPILWANSIVDPFLWRIIEQDNYQSVITLLDQKRQQKIQEIFNYDAMKKRLNIKWKQQGITINTGNSQENKLSGPTGIFIDDDQNIYVADQGNHRIVEWKCNATNGQIVAGGNGSGNQTNQLHSPTDVIIDKENNSLIIADYKNRRVMRWSRQDNTEHGQIIIENIDCHGLAMDKNGSFYVSDCERNEVRRWKRGDTEGTIVAGGNGEGNQLNQFNYPTFIFIDEDYSLYVSDTWNHRVMKWLKDAKEGIVVAGGNGEGNSLTQLSHPSGVIVDQLGQIYVTGADNNRVMRWYKGAKEGTIVVGGNGEGEQSNQFSSPKALSFDRQGNLYVVDSDNNRIQKFEIN